MVGKKTTIVAVIVAVVGAFFTGQMFAPKEVEIKEVERVVYKERKQVEEKSDKQVRRKTITLPDGSKVVDEIITTKKRSRKKQDIALEDVKVKEKKVKIRPEWRAGVIYSPPYRQRENYIITVEKRLFSEVYMGVSASTNQTYGISISIGF